MTLWRMDRMRMLGWSLVLLGAVVGAGSPLYADMESKRLYREWMDEDRYEPATYDMAALERRARDLSLKVSMMKQGLRPAWTVGSPWPALYVGIGIAAFGVLILAIRRPLPSSASATGLLGLALLLGGCISVTPEGEKVRVTRNANDVRECRSLGQDNASSGWGGFAAGPGFDNNKHQLQNWTASIGGDTLLLLSERGAHVPQTFGEAFKCAR